MESNAFLEVHARKKRKFVTINPVSADFLTR
jgi:hypothetical protein